MQFKQKGDSLSYSDIYRGCVLRAAVAEIRDSVVELLLFNSQGCAAKPEYTPEEIVHSHIRPDVIKCAVRHKHNGNYRGVLRNLADVRISYVRLIYASVSNSYQVYEDKRDKGYDSRLAGYLKQEITAVMIVVKG